MKILIADDDRVSRHLLEVAVASMGHDVIVADNGTDAMEALMAPDGPRLAVLDWMMPGVDGVEVCRAVRGRTAPYTYVILLTARDRHADMLHALDAGADDFLRKPCDAVELRVRLKAGVRIIALQQDLLETQAALKFEATHDRLTGLWNRGTILDHLSREMSRARREGSTVSVMLADIDHFKRINDEHGHGMGDRVLCELAVRMQAVLRDYDGLGRYGGEEFLVVLPADLDKARDVAERIRAAVATSPIAEGDDSVWTSTSIGVAASTLAGYDPTAAVRAADAALYRAKAGGRNQVVLARGTAEESPARAPYGATTLTGVVRGLAKALRS